MGEIPIVAATAEDEMLAMRAGPRLGIWQARVPPSPMPFGWQEIETQARPLGVAGLRRRVAQRSDGAPNGVLEVAHLLFLPISRALMGGTSLSPVPLHFGHIAFASL